MYLVNVQNLLKYDYNFLNMFQRIQQLLKYQKRILQHIVYIKQNFAGHERYQWHTLEQLQMENYFKK